MRKVKILSRTPQPNLNWIVLTQSVLQGQGRELYGSTVGDPQPARSMPPRSSIPLDEASDCHHSQKQGRQSAQNFMVNVGNQKCSGKYDVAGREPTKLHPNSCDPNFHDSPKMGLVSYSRCEKGVWGSSSEIHLLPLYFPDTLYVILSKLCMASWSQVLDYTACGRGTDGEPPPL